MSCSPIRLRRALYSSWLGLLGSSVHFYATLYSADESSLTRLRSALNRIDHTFKH